MLAFLSPQPSNSLRSFSSLSTGSTSTSPSLSSTFSDISVSCPPSPPISTSGAKTNAFFASPFSTHSMPFSPRPTASNVIENVENKQPSHSLTQDFFSTPIHPPSPPRPLSPTLSHRTTDPQTIHSPHIFFSRHASSVGEPAPKTMLHFLDLDSNHSNNTLRDLDLLTTNITPLLHFQPPSPMSSQPSLSSSSWTSSSPTDSLFNSSPKRLPTPPPPRPPVSSDPNLAPFTLSPRHRAVSLPVHGDDKKQYLVPQIFTHTHEPDHPDELTPRQTNMVPTLASEREHSSPSRALLFQPLSKSLIIDKRIDSERETREIPSRNTAVELVQGACDGNDPVNYPEPGPGTLISSSPPLVSVAILPLNKTSGTPASSSLSGRFASEDCVQTRTPTLAGLTCRGTQLLYEYTQSTTPSSSSPTFPFRFSSLPTSTSTSELNQSLESPSASYLHLSAQTPSPTPLHFSPVQSASPTSSQFPSNAKVRDPSTYLRLERHLGQGTFSSVWLAHDLTRVSLLQARKADWSRARLSLSRSVSRSSSIRSLIEDDLSAKSSIQGENSPRLQNLCLKDSTLSRSASLKKSENSTLARNASLKKFRARVRGTRPAPSLGRTYLDERHGEMGVGMETSLCRSSIKSTGGEDGRCDVSTQESGRLVAVKLTPRHTVGGSREDAERTRVGFVREVEVLRHISHPNITPLLGSLSTPSHHVLILPYLPGGDLLALVNNDIAWGKFTENLLQQIWRELCNAVGWMHGVGLVHRDIKLENILLTTPALTDLTPTSPCPTVDSLPAPLIQLTDFGLSRFVEVTPDGDAELLETRCGSEAYAAPELVTGGARRTANAQAVLHGVYDARETDAWACGVVLYALIGRRLPFGEGVGTNAAAKVYIGGERTEGARSNLAARRSWLMRIAKGEWEWPEETRREGGLQNLPNDELVGPTLVRSLGARRMVDRLLVRDPARRARVGELWNDPWMLEDPEGEARICNADHGHRIDIKTSPCPSVIEFGDRREIETEFSYWTSNGTGGPSTIEDEAGYIIDGGVDEEDGLLLDQHDIDSIARQEVF